MPPSQDSVDNMENLGTRKRKVYHKMGLSSYLVWVGVKFSNAKEEKFLIEDTSQISSKKFDFSIERFRQCV